MLSLVIIAFIVVFGLSGISCKSEAAEETVAETEETVAETEEAVAEEVEEEIVYEDLSILDILETITDMNSENLDAPRTRDIAVGPDGEAGVSYKELLLTGEEIAAIREKADSGEPYTAVVAWHQMRSQKDTVQALGAKEALEYFGVKVIDVSEAHGDCETHIKNLMTHAQQNPDLIISVPYSEKAEAETYRKLAQDGIKLVTVDLRPYGLSYPDEVQGFVTANDRGNGYTCAEYMGNWLLDVAKIENPEVAAVKISFYHYCTAERIKGWQLGIEELFPSIKIVEIAGCEGRSETGTYKPHFDALFARHPELDGCMPFYDYPALDAALAAKTAGFKADEFCITTTDLNEVSVMEMLTDGYIKELSTPDPYTVGVSAAILGIKALLGNPGPPFVSVQGFAATPENAVEIYETIYRVDASPELKQIYDEWKAANGG